MRRGRHWVRSGVFLEVPGNWMSDPVDVVPIGSLTLRVLRREILREIGARGTLVAEADLQQLLQGLHADEHRREDAS